MLYACGMFKLGLNADQRKKCSRNNSFFFAWIAFIFQPEILDYIEFRFERKIHLAVSSPVAFIPLCIMI